MPRLKSIATRIGALPARIKPPPKIADRFHSSPEWLRLMTEIKRDRANWCERCGSTKRVIGDDIKKLKDGGVPLDPYNIQLLCITCHNPKTAKARAGQATTATR